MSGTLLDSVSAWLGILPEWHGLDGQQHVTTPDTKRALLAGMGLETSEAALGDLLKTLEQEEEGRLLPAEYVIEAEAGAVLPLKRDSATPWQLTGEGAEALEGIAEGAVVLPPLRAGYYSLRLGGAESLILAAPSRAPGPQDLTGKGRLWGFTGALYSLRSARNMGLGDYADLVALARTLGGIGADFLGMNPVHAIGTAAEVISPYSPSHRIFLDSRHIAPDQAPEYEISAEAKRQLAEQAARLAQLRESPLVDYGAVAACQTPILKALHDGLRSLPEDHPRRQAFGEFRQSRGEALQKFCLFEALSEDFGWEWRQWPEALREPSSQQVQAFAREHEQRLNFHAYLQWLADEQLAAAQASAREGGMALGLYSDLAVGVRPNGAEAWAEPGLFASGVSLGAPPDYFNPAGQTWGLLPFNPRALRSAGYRPFIDTIRAVARHAGMVRIDHVIGLQRCFWVPEDGTPGGYVANSLDTLLAIVRIEAWRAACIVIGEDLGVVPPGLPERMRAQGLPGCCVMQFERGGDGAFRHPRDFPEATLASFGTHDTPTLAGFWAGSDIEERLRLGQIDEAGRSESLSARQDERRALAALAGQDGGQQDVQLSEEMRLGIHAALASRGSALAAVQLDDVVGEKRQPNMPGTVDEYPNWRLKSAVTVEDWASRPELQQIAGLFNA